MAYYRLYFIKGGHFSGCRDFHARDDGEALATAGTFAGHEATELWCQGRLVRALAPVRAACG